MPATPITHLQFKDKKVLVRCDFNVPMHEGKIQDPARIDASLETIRYVLEHGGSAVLCSHLGRPKERSAELSLKPVAEYLSTALGQKVALAPDCIGDHTGKMIDALKPGEAILLENLRFHAEEEANDRDFSHELARGKQVYVNDAFGTAHRAHASTVGVTRFLSERAAGLLMIRELEALRAVTENPKHPAVAILGGAKVSDKIGVIRNLITKVDAILIGGAMAYTFLKAQGIAVGRSRVEDDKVELARELLAEAEKKSVRIVLPVDHVVAGAPEANSTVNTVTEIPSELMGAGYRAADRGRIYCGNRARKDCHLERPARILRNPRIRHRHDACGRSACQPGRRRVDNRRRRHRRRSRASAMGEKIHPHLHRRRRLPGIPRRPRTPWRKGPRSRRKTTSAMIG